MTGNGIKLFQNSDLNCNIRTVTINDEPWFVAKDICEAFGDSDHKRSISRLDEEEKQILPVKDRLGRNQDATVVNESGLYSLLFGFEPQKAKKDGGAHIAPHVQERIEKLKSFKRWVTHEVLPSIRKHGAYATETKLEEMLADPDTMILTLQALKTEREKRKALEVKAAEDAPYTHFGRCVEVSDGCILIGEFAKILAQNGIETGQNRLFEYLRGEGIMGRHGNRHNVPAQEYIEAGYFRLTYRVIQRSDGSQQSKPTPYLTPRGQIWLMKRLGLTLENTPAA